MAIGPIALLLLISLGCQGSMPVSAVPVDRSLEPSTSVLLGPGDEIEIKFAYADEFNEIQKVRPDGKIELQLVGEIDAAGKTPDQLREELIKLYAEELKYPQLAVIVRSFHGRRVYVGGEVNKPGLIEMPARMTALEAIMEAGGYKIESAEVKNVVIVRQENGRRSAFLVDLKDAISGQDVQSVYLEPRDIVYVSRTKIKNANQWMQNHLWDFLPPILPSVGVGF
jgi:polysaccharide export outer membrane protein